MTGREPSAARIQARAHLRRGARHTTQPGPIGPDGPDLFDAIEDDVRACTECDTWPCDDHDTTDESED